MSDLVKFMELLNRITERGYEVTFWQSALLGNCVAKIGWVHPKLGPHTIDREDRNFYGALWAAWDAVKANPGNQLP